MKGYIYLTEAQAIAARKKAADYKGLPVRPEDVTQYWVGYNYSKLDDIYYIRYVDGLEEVLGEPVDVELTPIEDI